MIKPFGGGGGSVAFRSKEREAAQQRERFVKLRVRRDEFLAQGLCLACGAEPVLDRKYCYDHLRYFRQYTRERQKRLLRARLCAECGCAPSVEGMRRCVNCRERRNARQRRKRKQ